MVRDPRDKALPNINANIVFEDPYSQDRVLVNLKEIQKEYKDHVTEQEKILRNVFLKSKADLLSLTTDTYFVKPLIDFFNRRKKRQ